MVTPLTDALMDSIPLVCITGQVPTHLIGNDAFQECDTVGITRPSTKHNWLVRNVNDLAKVLHEAFYVASTGRPGPVVVDVPKDVQFAVGTYHPPRKSDVHVSYAPRVKGDATQIRKAVALLASARRPVIYSGGSIINSGTEASKLLRELVEATGFPITSTLMGLGAYPASGQDWLGIQCEPCRNGSASRVGMAVRAVSEWRRVRCTTAKAIGISFWVRAGTSGNGNSCGRRACRSPMTNRSAGNVRRDDAGQQEILRQPLGEVFRSGAKVDCSAQHLLHRIEQATPRCRIDRARADARMQPRLERNTST